MREIWLHTNRRALWLGCIPPLVACVIGAWMLVQTTGAGRSAWWWLGAPLLIVGLGLLGLLARELRRPRLAFENGEVLFYLRSGGPLAVPVRVVEAFFVGQGPAELPAGVAPRQRTMNLVARLSQRETAFARREVKPALGQWQEGYVTIRGTWCEPLGPDLIRRLNRRLKEVKTKGESEGGDDSDGSPSR